jgi:signal peptidase
MKLVRRTAAVTAGLLTVILAAAILYLAISPLQAKLIMTGSMKPDLPPGTIVLVKPQHRYQANEVVSFTNPYGHTVTHRLVGFEPNGTLITKGDANDAPDGWRIAPSAVQGEVVGSIPYVGRVRLWADDAVQRTRLYFAGIRADPLTVIPLLVFAAGALLGVASLKPRRDEDATP